MQFQSRIAHFAQMQHKFKHMQHNFKTAENPYI